MKQSFFLSVLLVVPFVVSAQATSTPAAPAQTVPVVLADPGLVPGDFFYFLDQWGEGMRSFFAFSAESKARIALEHAQERAAEVHAVIAERGIDAPEAQRAKDGFGKEVARAATVVAEEKSKGVDVSALAKEVDDELELSKEMLKEAYRDYHDALKNKEKDLQEKLKDAVATKDTALQAEISTELEKANKDSLKTLDEEGSVEDGFDAEKSTLEEAMGLEHAAEAHIANIDRKYEQAKQEAAKKGVALDPVLMTQYTDLNTKADQALKAGDFEAAKTYAKEAQDVLRDAERFGTRNSTKDLEKNFFGETNEKAAMEQKAGEVHEVDMNDR